MGDVRIASAKRPRGIQHSEVWVAACQEKAESIVKGSPTISPGYNSWIRCSSPLVSFKTIFTNPV